MIASVTEFAERKREAAEELKLQARFQQAQMMDAIGTLAGGIAHQFNNALVGIVGNIELLQLDLAEETHVDKYVRPMMDCVKRMAQLTEQLLAYARGGKYQPESMSLADCVRKSIPLIITPYRSGIHLEMDLAEESSRVEADVAQMQMVLSAVVANATEAIEDSGLIRVLVHDMVADEESSQKHPGLKTGKYVCLTVTDDGKGMDEATKRRLFEPFFTTKVPGRGLGMAAVYGIVRNHDGWIAVNSTLGEGTEVKIFLPALDALPSLKGDPSNQVVKGQGTILVVEDEEPVMNVSQAMLERLGYQVLQAKSGNEAVAIADSFEGNIDLAILDIGLPDMAGNEVYPQLKTVRPDLKVLVCSGYAIDGPAQEILDRGGEGFIQKPFLFATLSEKVKEVLERTGLRDQLPAA
jgi:nitrogen-specific signal transduction histidine kinase/ActR/RegA family two-component response regulator